ncbi:MAG: efflux RND transporter permease subunit [Candidatus Omnitrophica bacterium]|nr:efflux RND transporter permease subunit [Candidatus Omnitrophota bacterium]MCM8791464.1 efflux RND transporter permease subunit [Candidatus Omnitrophota bacterium]
MSLPSFSIHRPVTMLMIYIILVLMGILSLTQLPVELYPNISFGEVSIIIEVRGGIPPTEVESLVTKVVEEGVGTVSHLEEMLSISKEGESTVVLSFEPGLNMNFAALEVREKFARVKNRLPKEIEKPIIAQFKRSDVPIVIMAVTSLKRTTEELRKMVDENIRESIKRINGVADADVAGGRERKILVEADQRKMAAYGLPLDKLIAMISANNLNLLSGGMDVGKEKYLIRAIGLYQSVDDIKNIPVSALPNGTIVRLKDVANVVDSYLEATGYARVNIRPVVSVYVQKESTANTIQVAKAVEEEVERLRERLPKDIQIIITSNQADFIKKSIDNLKGSLLQGAGLIILVLTYFLVKLKKKFVILTSALILAVLFMPISILPFVILALIIAAAIIKLVRPILIVSSAIPISVIITFIFMYWMKLSVNFMTLFGLALGVGMLVDNSIVVFENILQKNERGLSGIAAAVAGAEEVWIAIWASTLTTIVVFLPMVFVGEEIKLLYGGVAWTVTFSLIISLFVAITIVPLLSSRMRFSVEAIPKGYGKDVSGFMKRLYDLQRKGVTRFLRHRYRYLIFAFIALAVAFFLFTRLGMEFLGTTEQNKFTIFIEMPTGTKLEVTDSIVKKVEAIVKEIPEVKTFSARVEPWSSKVYVELVSLTERKRSVSQVIESIRPKVERLKPAFIYFEEQQEVGTKELIIELFGYDYATMREIAISMATRLGAIKGFTDTKIRMREGRPELGLKVDRKKIGIFNMTVQDVADMVHAQMRGLRATLFHTEASEVETIARLDEKYRKTFKDLHKLILMNREEDKIYLDQLVDFKYGLGPSEIWRKNKSRMIQVSSNIGAIPLSKAAEIVKKTMSDLKLPEGYYWRIGGNFPTMMATQKQFRAIIILIIVLIYLVLASLFESYYQPFIIMVSVPLALIGVVIALYAAGKSVGMGVLVGIMMLGGIVVNNAILLIDHANGLRRKGMNHLKAVIVASRDRLRPILMTTITTLLGLLPMAISTQEGSNLWSPLAITVMGGLSSSTILTLLLVPSAYVVTEDLKGRIAGFFRKNLKNKSGASPKNSEK